MAGQREWMTETLMGSNGSIVESAHASRLDISESSSTLDGAGRFLSGRHSVGSRKQSPPETIACTANPFPRGRAHDAAIKYRGPGQQNPARKALSPAYSVGWGIGESGWRPPETSMGHRRLVLSGTGGSVNLNEVASHPIRFGATYKSRGGEIASAVACGTVSAVNQSDERSHLGAESEDSFMLKLSEGKGERPNQFVLHPVCY